MKPHEAAELIDTIKRFVEKPAPFPPNRSVKEGDVQKQNGDVKTTPVPVDDFDKLYRRIKERIIEDARVDPIFLKLIASQPELLVEIEPRQVNIEGASLRGRIGRLMVKGFFSEPRKQGTVRAELARTGSDVNSGNLSTAINEFVNQGFLTREGDGYQMAPGVKCSEHVITSK